MVQLVNHSGYPMFFTRKTENIRMNEVKAVFKENTAPVAANEIAGTAYLAIALEEPLKIGEEFRFRKEQHTVMEIQEERPAKGNHKVEGGGVHYIPENQIGVYSPVSNSVNS